MARRFAGVRKRADRAGFEALYPVSPSLRLGGGLLYTFDNEVEWAHPGEGDFELGSDLSLLAIPELVLHPAPAVSLGVRGQAGLLLVIPGGDQADHIKDGCDDFDDINTSCDVGGGAYVGVTYGVGLGIAFAVQPVRIRADLIAQGHVVTWTDLSLERWGDDASFSATLAGHRIWLTAGLEL